MFKTFKEQRQSVSSVANDLEQTLHTGRLSKVFQESRQHGATNETEPSGTKWRPRTQKQSNAPKQTTSEERKGEVDLGLAQV